MSDGPHRSLPMRRGWRGVAERGDNHAFASEEIGQAIIPALEEDCRDDMSQQFLDAIHGLYHSLFKDQLAAQLEDLRHSAGCGIGRSVLEHAQQLAASGETDIDAPVKALMYALTDRAASGARQIEEHYCRESTVPRALAVRARIEQAIGDKGAEIERLSRRILKIDSSPSTPVTKHQGLDDGVRF